VKLIESYEDSFMKDAMKEEFWLIVGDVRSSVHDSYREAYQSALIEVHGVNEDSCVSIFKKAATFKRYTQVAVYTDFRDNSEGQLED